MTLEPQGNMHGTFFTAYLLCCLTQSHLKQKTVPSSKLHLPPRAEAAPFEVLKAVRWQIRKQTLFSTSKGIDTKQLTDTRQMLKPIVPA